MVLEREAPVGRDLALAALDVLVEELLDAATAQAHEVVVVVAMVENAGTGGSVAAPIARQVIAAALGL